MVYQRFRLAKPRKIKGWMAWSPIPGQNIDDICRVFEPTISNLGRTSQELGGLQTVRPSNGLNQPDGYQDSAKDC